MDLKISIAERAPRATCVHPAVSSHAGFRMPAAEFGPRFEDGRHPKTLTITDIADYSIASSDLGGMSNLLDCTTGRPVVGFSPLPTFSCRPTIALSESLLRKFVHTFQACLWHPN